MGQAVLQLATAGLLVAEYSVPVRKHGPSRWHLPQCEGGLSRPQPPFGGGLVRLEPALGGCSASEPESGACNLNRGLDKLGATGSIRQLRRVPQCWAATAQVGLVAEVPSKFARAGGGRPDFGPKKSKKTHKNPS